MKPCRRQGLDHKVSLGIPGAAAEMSGPNHFQVTVGTEATSGSCHLDRSFSELFLTTFSNYLAQFYSPQDFKSCTFQLKRTEALKSCVFAYVRPFWKKGVYAKCSCA